MKESVCVRDGQSTGVLLSVPSRLVLSQYSHLHKVPACSPANRSIYPWNSCTANSLRSSSPLNLTCFSGMRADFSVQLHLSYQFKAKTLNRGSIPNISIAQTNIPIPFMEFGQLCHPCAQVSPDKIYLTSTDCFYNPISGRTDTCIPTSPVNWNKSKKSFSNIYTFLVFKRSSVHFRFSLFCRTGGEFS